MASNDINPNVASDPAVPNTTTDPADSTRCEDAELDALLDSALEDFGKPLKHHNHPPINSEPAKKAPTDVKWTEEFIQQATKQFELNMRRLLKTNSTTVPEEVDDMQAKLNQFAEAAAKTTIEESEADDLGSLLNDSLKELAEESKKLQEDSLSDEEMSRLFGGIGLDDAGVLDAGGDNNDHLEAFMPFMQNMMSSLLSKDILYPAIKDVQEKYPDWLCRNRSSLEPNQYKKYSDQSELMRLVCTEFESEKGTDSEYVKKERFERILQLMHKMQSCGQPPQELVCDDGAGIPTIPEQCSIM